ncbi:tRNA lysidine(34) synthetase TilS [Planococcus lenghuensis]|uniref:tRNA(Ile)-lysidine synthase n=1 Tax=Planococcus lenghuensis TaxID=2213202 RepID=A0A1Q2KU37_9BACL|nr:tRNA lysidine(34) synthetase TilS [Planococcus lenghuensis]AQQ51725.1 tRNA lysidine(34) synthetase TilS [Planococcus lenghuensis]
MRGFPQQVLAFIKKKRLLRAGDRVCVACSGGADSIALLHVLKQHEQTLDIQLSAVHVDHMLRGEESAADRLFVEEVCRKWGVPCYSTAIPVPDLLKAEGGNRQAVSRKVRYQYFTEVMKRERIQKLATAHHADDQLESLLMTGLRGTLQTGSFGIPVSRPIEGGQLVRPFLTVSRLAIENYVAASDLAFRQDPSNFSAAYTRNRLRLQVIPLLKEENPEAAVQAALLAESVQQDQQYLEEAAGQRLAELVSKSKSGNHIEMSAQAFRQCPAALQKRMLPLLLSYLYPKKHVNLTVQLAEQMQEILRCSSGTVFLHLPHDLLMIREYDDVRFLSADRAEQASDDREIIIGSDWSEPVAGYRFKVVSAAEKAEMGDVAIWYFSPEERLPLIIRKRKNGDRIQLAGMDRPKKVARLMIDEKVPLVLRENWPLIVTKEDEVLLIPGFRASKHLTESPAHGDWLLITQPVTGQAEK